MALTANTFYTTQPAAGKRSYVVENGTTIYVGALVGVDANGYLTNWADEAGLEFKGLAEEKAVGDTSASPPVRCRVDESGQTLKGVTVTGLSAISSLNELVHASDENTLTLTGNVLNGAVGMLVGHDSSSTGDVELFTPQAARGLSGTPAVFSFQVALASITGAGDVVTTFTPGFAGRIVKWFFTVNVAVTTASKAATLNLEVGTTNLTGGTIALTSANCTPQGAVIAQGSAFSAGTRFGASDTISVEASSVTAFAEGDGTLTIITAAD